MIPPIIETPRGVIVVTPSGKAELKFNAHFRNRWQSNYSDAQKYMDSAVLMDCEPYVPLLTSMLIKSGILGTDIGSGQVKWIAPYAKAQYYKGRKPGTSNTGPLRGKLWFERSKAVNKNKWISGARKIAGRS
jgi:hypothetical protein